MKYDLEIYLQIYYHKLPILYYYCFNFKHLVITMKANDYVNDSVNDYFNDSTKDSAKDSENDSAKYSYHNSFQADTDSRVLN